MLAKRIIPCLDVRDGRVVKGVNFVNIRDAGDPVENALYYDEQGADELVFLDITASHEKRNIILNVVEKTANDVFMPLTVGGGIRNLDDIRDLLNAGCDKVSINTTAIRTPGFIREASEKFGSQCIVVAIDARRCSGASGEPPDWLLQDESLEFLNLKSSIVNRQSPIWEVYTHGGRKPRGLDAVRWAQYMEELGAGEILLTSMDRDGTKDGYDIELTSTTCYCIRRSRKPRTPLRGPDRWQGRRCTRCIHIPLQGIHNKGNKRIFKVKGRGCKAMSFPRKQLLRII